jgi:hypothetical protein
MKYHTGIAIILFGFFNPAFADSDIQAGITPNQGISQGKETEFTLHLLQESNNQPITFDDLKEMHTKKIHLLVIDPSLTDYHHEHPQPTSVSGAYSFSFTANKGGDYIAFAEMTPVKSNHAIYLPIYLQVTGKSEAVIPNPDVASGQLQKNQTVSGLVFTTSIDSTDITANQDYMMSIHITDQKTNQPFTALEPVMGAFAHMVGFNQDRSEVVHVHPMGKEPENDDARGGPDLEFHISFPSTGFYRLFAQVQIDGKNVFVPLDVQVK